MLIMFCEMFRIFTQLNRDYEKAIHYSLVAFICHLYLRDK